MPTESQFRECSHVKENGDRCQSPSLRRQSLCFFHHPEAREIHRMKQVALRLHPNKVAMLDFAEQWPKHPSKEVRALLTNAFQIMVRLNGRSAAEEVSAQGLGENSLGRHGSEKKCRGPSTRA